jgi:hypothetical protein
MTACQWWGTHSESPSCYSWCLCMFKYVYSSTCILPCARPLLVQAGYRRCPDVLSFYCNCEPVTGTVVAFDRRHILYFLTEHLIRRLWNLNVYCSFHRSWPLGPVLNHVDSFRTRSPCWLHIDCSFFRTFMPICFKRSLTEILARYSRTLCIYRVTCVF